MNNIHALIIDDNAYNVEVLMRLLAAENATCNTLQNPAKLQDMLQELDDVDIVFLDLEMPKIDGYEMLEILRDDVGLSVPIVAYTVHTSEIDVARNLGFHSFLGKPLDPERFPDQLARILNGEQVWDIP